METERRISHRLVSYWQQIKEDRPLPSPDDIDSEEIADMWEDCFLIGIHSHADGETTYSYDYVGDGLRPVFQEGFGHSAQLVSLPGEKLLAMYHEMAMTNLPIVEHVEEFFMDGHEVRYRQCLLPMGEHGRITHIFGGMRFKYV